MKYYFIVFIGCLLCLGFGNQKLSAQSLSDRDLSKVKVDDLSERQIKQFVERAEKEGLNENQLEEMAKARGMKPSEVRKLRSRIQELNLQKEKQQAETKGQVRPGEQQEKDRMQLSEEQEEERYKLSKIFGFSLFNNENLTFEPQINIAAPSDYQLASGDELQIDIWGASQMSYTLEVQSQGTIYVQNVGPIQVSGLTLKDAENRIKYRLSQIYSGLRGSNPNTYAQVNLSQMRGIRVNVVGEVFVPGTFTLPAMANVFHALYSAGGPSRRGSLRSIDVLREGKLVGSLDVYAFLMKPDYKGNINLQDGDVVRVKTYQHRIETEGELRRPMSYELKEGESLSDLFEYAGGFTGKAFRNTVTIHGLTEKERFVKTVRHHEFNDFKPKDGFKVKVGEVLERYTNRVQISGAVMRAGEYELTDSMKVMDLIEIADGIRGDAYVQRATIYRTLDDFSIESISFDLRKVLQGEGENHILQREDLLVIPSRYDIQEEYFVNVVGEVNDPGTYPFVAGSTISDMVKAAGGFNRRATGAKVEVARHMKSKDGTYLDELSEVFRFSMNDDLSIVEGDDFFLEPFDKIFIRKAPGFEEHVEITLKGEVVYPGVYVLKDKRERISSVIQRAGGLSPAAYPEGATLIRRTEFFEENSDLEKRIKRMEELQNRKEVSGNKRSLTEAEERRKNRLDDLYNRLQKMEDSTKDTAEADLLRQRIQDLEDEGTASSKLKFNEEEAVNIQLAEIMSNPGSKYDLILQEGDVIYIPRELQTVRLRGEVLYPTTTRYESGKRLRYYVKRAGGFSADARRKDAYVIYPNGEVKSTRSALGIKAYPKIERGSEIYLPKKPERKPLTPQEAIAIGSGLSSLALVVITIINQLN